MNTRIYIDAIKEGVNLSLKVCKANITEEEFDKLFDYFNGLQEKRRTNASICNFSWLNYATTIEENDTFFVHDLSANDLCGFYNYLLNSDFYICDNLDNQFQRCLYILRGDEDIEKRTDGKVKYLFIEKRLTVDIMGTKMTSEKYAVLEKRMYTLVMYNLSPIQQGIQAAHSIVDYQLAHGDNVTYIDWAKNWKTMIVLNGGTSNSSSINSGSMEKHLHTLKLNSVLCEGFHEPDANESLTAISFIVDERVFNRVKYPDFADKSLDHYDPDGDYSVDGDAYKKWLNSIGGLRNKFLRDFTSKFRLA